MVSKFENMILNIFHHSLIFIKKKLKTKKWEVPYSTPQTVYDLFFLFRNRKKSNTFKMIYFFSFLIVIIMALVLE